MRGRGTFPLDMLRHDRCWPHTVADVERMHISERFEREIVLSTDKNRPGITPLRWNSFGWSCTQGITAKV